MTATAIFVIAVFLLLGIAFGFIAGGGASGGYAPAGGSDGADDLKKISGVGPTIEKKLHAMGVTRYEQIANWKAADIKAADDKLNFKGRIKRENWVKQAKILASGGETEFSRKKK